jgi:hypothetical protein
MRKIYRSAPDVPQGIANKAIDIIQRHIVKSEVRRAEELPEESKIHLMRELQGFFQQELPPLVRDKYGREVYSHRLHKSMLSRFIRWLHRMTGSDRY